MNAPAEPAARVHLPCLLLALGLMAGLTMLPHGFTRVDGRADALAVMLTCWAMSAGLVRGVGFVPEARTIRLLLGGWACLAALGLALMRLAWPWLVN